MRSPCVRLALAFLLLVRAAAAEPPPRSPLRLSIGDAMRLAERNSEEVAAAVARVAGARAQVTIARSAALPQLSATASYERTLESEFDDLFGGGGGGEFANLPFGREDVYRLGLSLSQLLFAGGRVRSSVRLARANTRQAELGLETTRGQAVLGVTAAYYDALLAGQLLAIAEATLRQAEDTLTQVTQLFAEKQRPEFDVLRARTAVENGRVAVAQRRRDLDLAALRLHQALNIPRERELALTTGLATPLEDVGRLAREVVGLPAVTEGPRLAVRAAEQAVEARAAAVDVARAARWPVLQLVSQYGRVAYDLSPGWSDFRTNWTVGLTLELPLFTGGRLRAEVGSARAVLSETRAGLDIARESAALEDATAAEDLRAALAVLRSSTLAVEQAQRTYDIAVVRFREGLSTQVELTDARLLLEQARATEARAARDVQVARVHVALLPALPVETRSPLVFPAVGFVPVGVTP